MLISKLSKAFDLINREYTEFRVNELLLLARATCAKKDTMQDDKFKSNIIELISSFKSIETNSRYYNIEKEIREKIERTTIRNAVAIIVSKYMSNSLNTDKLICMSHGEINLMINSSINSVNSILNFMRISDDFSDGDDVLYPDKLHIDIVLPRVAMGSNLDHMSVALRDFSQFIGLVAEYSYGEHEGGEIVSLSTTEPVVTVAVFVASGIALLTLYNKILESAKKTLDFIQAYNAFKVHSEALKVVDVKELAAAEIEKQINVAIEHIKSSLPESKKAESKNKITSKARKIAGLIEGGARIRTNALGGVLANGGTEEAGVMKIVEDLSQQANEFNELMGGGMSQTGLLTFDDAGALGSGDHTEPQT